MKIALTRNVRGGIIAQNQVKQFMVERCAARKDVRQFPPSPLPDKRTLGPKLHAISRLAKGPLTQGDRGRRGHMLRGAHVGTARHGAEGLPIIVIVYEVLAQVGGPVRDSLVLDPNHLVLVIVPEKVPVLIAVFDREEMLLPIVVHCPDVVAFYVPGNVCPCTLLEPVVVAVQAWCVIKCRSREEVGHFL